MTAPNEGRRSQPAQAAPRPRQAATPTATTLACRYLVANGPSAAACVGIAAWQGKRRGKTTSMGGGGDYGAQMLLGRMRAAGLVRHAPSEGSTLWEITALGRVKAAT